MGETPSAREQSSSTHEQPTFVRGTANTAPVEAFIPKPGERIGEDGRFEIISALGQGGMGLVFRANDRQLDRPTAVKFILPAQGLSWDELVSQLRLEAKATARLNHENIVSIFDLDVWKGAPFLVMELMEGKSLRDMLIQDSVSPLAATEILLGVSRGLLHAHRNGVIHRDLKPSNVFILKDGKPKILDFGLARNDQARAEMLIPGSRSSQDVPLAGTPAYMSPEQWRQEPQDHRTDIWAMGVMLFEVMVGEVPFAASDLTKFLAAPLPKFIPPSIRARRAELPSEADRIIARTMAPYPADRYQTTDELIAALVGLRDVLKGARSDSKRVHAAAERRVLTMLSCTVSAIPSPDGELDPEEVGEAMRLALGLSLELIEQFEGTVATSVSGQLLACFGYPLAQEDDAHRAIRAGLQIAKVIRERTPLLGARIGVHTGPVIVQGTMAGGQKGVPAIQGDVPEIATWLASRADTHGVLISARTQQLVQGVLETQQLPLEPGAARTGAYKVLRETGVVSRFEALAQLTPLIGRERESELLGELWKRTQAGNGQFAMLSGEPGMGKSRVAHDLQGLVAQTGGAALLCQCWPHFRNSAYYPVISLLLGAMDIRRDDLDAEKLRKLEAALKGLEIPLPENAPLLASLLSIPTADRYPPLGLTPEQQKLKTVEALANLLRRTSERQPILVTIEDLHWVDHSTLQLLNHLYHRVTTAKLMILVTFRPEFMPPWPEGEHLHHLAVDRLTPAASKALIQRAAGERSLSAEVVERAVARAEGVPLFLEQLARIVLDSEGGGAAAIPETLHDLLLARLDRLPSVGKEVAQLGSVIGREFSHDLIQHVWTEEKQELAHGLRSLLEAGLLVQTGELPQATYTFKHALIQEAGYQSLLKKSRQLSHKRIAACLVERFPETAEIHPELLAHHHAEAGNISEAISFFEKAGQRASARWAQQEAIHHYNRALQLLRSLPESADRNRKEVSLLLAVGAPLMAIQGYANPEVEKVYRRARELCKLAGEDTQLFPALMGLWQFYMVSGELPTSLELAEQVLSLARAAGSSPQLLLAHRALATSSILHGDLVRAREQTETGLGIYDFDQHKGLVLRFGHDPGVAHGLYAAWALWILGFPDASIGRAQAALELAKRLAHPVSIAWAQGYTAMIHNYRREPKAAKELAEAAVALSNEHRLALWLAWGTIQRGWATGNIDEFRQGMAGWMKTGARAGMTFFPVTLAEICNQVGKLDDAQALLAEASGMVEKNGEHFYEAELQRLQGEVALSRGLPAGAAEAEACFEKGLAIAAGQSARSWTLRLAMSLFELRSKQGRSGEAQPILEAAVGAFTEGLDTGDYLRAKSLLQKGAA